MIKARVANGRRDIGHCSARYRTAAPYRLIIFEIGLFLSSRDSTQIRSPPGRASIPGERETRDLAARKHRDAPVQRASQSLLITNDERSPQQTTLRASHEWFPLSGRSAGLLRFRGTTNESVALSGGLASMCAYRDAACAVFISGNARCDTELADVRCSREKACSVYVLLDSYGNRFAFHCIWLTYPVTILDYEI